MLWVNIVAILLSPVIAVLVTVFLQARKDSKQRRLWIFNSLIATRHSPMTDENVRALNMIDVVFYNSSRVRKLWHEYYDMLSNEGLNNPTGWAQRQAKNLEMITEMADVVGYGRAITALDVNRVYYPTALGVQSQTAHEISAELLRVLKASDGVRFVQRGTGAVGEQ